MNDTMAGLRRGTYGLILADPAWSWVSFSGKGSAPHRTAEPPYPVMTIDEMRALPVGDIAAKDAALVMWVIGSHLDQAIELGRHWGFTYKSDLFTWVKVGKNDPAVRPIGMGKWTRKQTEQALIFTRGSPRRLAAGIRQLFETDEHVIFATRREHSRKPDEQYERLERLIAGPYVELFARKSRSGWDSWGNQSTKFDDPILCPATHYNSEFDELLGGDSADELEDILG